MASNKNKGPSIRLLQSAIQDIKSNIGASSVKRDYDKSKHYKLKNSSQDIKSNLGVSSVKQDLDKSKYNKSKDCKKEKNEKKNCVDYLITPEMAELSKIIHEERKNMKETKNFKVPLGRSRNKESHSSLNSQFQKKRKSLPMSDDCLDAFAEEESIDNGMAYNSFNWPVQNLKTEDQSTSEPFSTQKNTNSYSLNNPNDFLNVSSCKNQSNDILVPESPKRLSLPKEIANISKTLDNQAKPFCVTHQEEVMSLIRNRKYLPLPSDENTEFRIYDTTSEIPSHFSRNEIIGTNSLRSGETKFKISPDKVSPFGLFNSEMNQAYNSSVTRDENLNLVTHSSYNKENYLPIDRNNQNKMPNDLHSQLIQSTSNEIVTGCTDNQKPSPIYSEYLFAGNTYPKVPDAVFNPTNPNHSDRKILKPGNSRISSQHIDFIDFEEIDNLIDSLISKMPNSSEAVSKQSNTKALEKFPNRNSGPVITDLTSSGSITSLTIDLNTESKTSTETKVVQNCQKNSPESSNMKISIINSGQAINSVKIINVTGSSEINPNNFM